MHHERDTARGEGRRYLVARTGSTRCALDLDMVRRILRSVTTFRVPGARPALLGLAQWGGEPLAVIDLQAELGGGRPVRSPHQVVVVVEIPGEEPETLGLMVDEALDVVRIPEGSIRSEGQGLLRGEIAAGDGVISVLRLEALGRE
jgi:chemotaxis signal transduction protein